MPRLVVVSGEPNTAKWATMMATAAEDRELRVLHRDQVRVLFGRLLDEPHLTRLMGDMAASLLRQGYGVVTAGQNLAPSDRAMWSSIADDTGASMEWVRTA